METGPNKPLKVLLDAGVFIHAQFSERAGQTKVDNWGGVRTEVVVTGLRRKPVSRDKDQQSQVDSLFTIGRLIRERRIEAFSYHEIACEIWRGRSLNPDFNALTECPIQKCSPALHRWKFFQTISLRDAIAKGGRRDRDAGMTPAPANQIAFFRWLLSRRKEQIELIASSGVQLGLTEFEIESVRKLEWYQAVCAMPPDSKRNVEKWAENYPDFFHFWTAQRNDCDVFLTVEKTFPRLVREIPAETKKRIGIETEVLQPLQLLKKLGVNAADPMPIEFDRFYHFHELP